ncbi:MAG TPA: arginine--tRNA ligase, partial [Candidatus Limnocylindria bacterium]
MTSLRDDLRAAIEAARDAAVAAGDLRLPEGVTLPPVAIERPARPEHGDYASNAAMQLAPLVRDAPMRI